MTTVSSKILKSAFLVILLFFFLFFFRHINSLVWIFSSILYLILDLIKLSSKLICFNEISRLLQSLTFQKIIRQITAVDSQPMFDGGVLINVLGRLQVNFILSHDYLIPLSGFSVLSNISISS